MKLWIRVDACTARDPKVAALAEAIGVSVPTAVGHLVMLWGVMAEHTPDGKIGQVGAKALEQWAGWSGKRGKFAESFVRIFSNDGLVGGWEKRQGALIQRQEKDRKRKHDGISAESRRNSAPTERNGTERETISAKAGADAPDFTNWNSAYGSEWERAQLGTAPFGRIGRALKKLIARDGPEKHWDAWCRFVRSEKAKFGPEYFAAHRRDFDPPPPKLALTTAGTPVMSPAETEAFKQAELDAINAHRVARGDLPIGA